MMRSFDTGAWANAFKLVLLRAQHTQHDTIAFVDLGPPNAVLLNSIKQQPPRLKSICLILTPHDVFVSRARVPVRLGAGLIMTAGHGKCRCTRACVCHVCRAAW